MKRMAAVLSMVGLGCLGARAQETLPAFEVASVKLLANFQPGLASEKIETHPGSLTMHSVRLRACLKWAYDVKDYQISGPSWLGSPGWMGADVARYEILAKAPEGTPVPEMKRMMQRLLAERFRMTLHRESKETSVMVLTAAAPKAALKASGSQEAEGSLGPGPNGALAFANSTMTEFADFMSGPLGGPILDRTGLSGRFDFMIESPKMNSREDALAAFPQAIREQLGLEIKRQKAPVEFLMVDSAERVPTGN